MKKIAVLCLTSFYLLLTTGMFVCLIHCSAEAMIPKSGIQTSDIRADSQMKACKGSKECGKCKKHGTFVIKENLKPGYHFGFPSSVPLNTPHYLTLPSFRPPLAVKFYSVIADISPPGRSGKEISIKLHSLQV